MVSDISPWKVKDRYDSIYCTNYIEDVSFTSKKQFSKMPVFILIYCSTKHLYFFYGVKCTRCIVNNNMMMIITITVVQNYLPCQQKSSQKSDIVIDPVLIL